MKPKKQVTLVVWNTKQTIIKVVDGEVHQEIAMNKQQEETLREHLRILDALQLDLERAGRVERDGLRIYNEALTALRQQESTILDILREALAGECPRCAAPVALHHGRPEPTCECDLRG